MPLGVRRKAWGGNLSALTSESELIADIDHRTILQILLLIACLIQSLFVNFLWLRYFGLGPERVMALLGVRLHGDFCSYGRPRQNHRSARQVSPGPAGSRRPGGRRRRGYDGCPACSSERRDACRENINFFLVTIGPVIRDFSGFDFGVEYPVIRPGIIPLRPRKGVPRLLARLNNTDVRPPGPGMLADHDLSSSFFKNF